MLDNSSLPKFTFLKNKFCNDISTESDSGINADSNKQFEEPFLSKSYVDSKEYNEHLEDNSISHLLAHTIRIQDTDRFISIYDQIPAYYTQNRISKIKEKSREFSELNESEFKTDCAQYNCTSIHRAFSIFNTTKPTPNKMHSIDNSLNNTTSNNNKTQTNNEDNDPSGGHITKNESFFSEHLRDPSKNPLLLNSLNRLNKLEMALDRMTSEEAAKITVSDAALFAVNFKEQTSPVNENTYNKNCNNNDNITQNSSSKFYLPLLTKAAMSTTPPTDSSMATMCRDGFVTNQRYQNLKDSKHSAGVLSTCYDEVFQVVGDDEDENSDNNSESSGKSNKNLRDSVVINMYNEDSDEDSNHNREKFEQNLKNYTEQRKLLDDDELPMPLTGKSKYEKDEELLKKYENECRFGAQNLLNSNMDVNNDEEINDDDTMESIEYFKFKSNFIAKANLMKDGVRVSSSESNAQRMKNDFSKNEDDEDEESDKSEQIEHTRETASAKLFDRPADTKRINIEPKANIQLKTLLNNKKPPLPPSTSLPHNTQKSLTNEIKQSPTTQINPDNYLLNNLVSHLKKKQATAPPSTNASKSMQFNNYRTNIDDYSNFGLSSSTSTDYGFARNKTDDTLISALNNRTNLSSLELGSSSNTAGLEDKKTSSSSSSSNSSSSGDYNKPGTINRRSAEAYMDSHGSSLTNSSKQEDEDDYEVDSESNNTVNNSNKSESNNPLISTIETLSHEHVKKSLSGRSSVMSTSTFKSGEFKSSSLASKNIATGTNSLLATGTSITKSGQSYNSIMYSSSGYGTSGSYATSKPVNSSSGVFHQKYSNCAYDPFTSSTVSTETTKLLNNISSTTTTTGPENSTSIGKNSAKNRKNKKSQLDPSLTNTSNNYSKHYTDDMNELLQFIESAPTSEATNVTGKPAKNNKKSTNLNSNSIINNTETKNNLAKPAKNTNRNKQTPPTSETVPTTATSEIIRKESPSKVNLKLNRSPSQQQNTDSKSQPLTKPEMQPKEAEVIKKGEKSSPPVVFTNYLVPEKLQTPQLSDCVEDLDDRMSAMNVSDEFVTVKGRKLRKESKKKELSMSNLNSNTNNKDTLVSKNQVLAKSKQQLTKTTSLEIKPVNPVVVNIQKQAAALNTLSKPKEVPTISKNTTNTSTLQPFAAVASSNLNKGTSTTTVTTANKDKPTAAKAIDTKPPYSLDTKQMTTVPASNLVNNELIDMTFPPLVPINKENQANKEPFITFMNNDLLIQSKPEIEVKALVEDNKPSEVNIEAAVVEPEEDLKPQISDEQPVAPAKATRKPKFDFMNNKESVIFCDEIGKKKPSVTSAVRSKSKETLLATDTLNGIKFGSIDSTSTSDEEEEEETTPRNLDIDQISESVNQAQLSVIKTKTPPKLLKKNKNLLKTNSNSSSSKSSSSMSIKTSTNRTATSSTTTSSTDNEEANADANKLRSASNRKAKLKSNSNIRNQSKASSSKQRLKSNSNATITASTASITTASQVHKVDESLSHDSSIIKNGPLISGLNSSQVHTFPAINLPQHLPHYPPQGPPQGPPYFFYNPNPQINNPYMTAYYAPVNNVNGPGGNNSNNGPYNYPMPNQFPPGVIAAHNFYAVPPPPIMSNQQPIIYQNPNSLSHGKQTTIQSSPSNQNLTISNNDVETINKQIQSSASSSTSPLLQNPPILTEQHETAANTTTTNQSSQSAESSNSTTPTPKAQTSQSKITEYQNIQHIQHIQINPQHHPQGMPIIQIPPDYYHQQHNFIPSGIPPNAFIHPGQFPYPYMPPPHIEYIQNDGLIPVPLNNMPVHIVNSLAIKTLNSSSVSSGNMSPSNHEIVEQINSSKSQKNNRYQQQNRNNHYQRNNNSNNYQNSVNNTNTTNFNNQNNQYFQNQPQHYVPNIHQLHQQVPPPPLVQPLLNHEVQYYPNRMPYNGPIQIGPHPGMAGQPIDPARNSYVPIEYRGEFNMDETAFYVANQWNTMKQFHDNGNGPPPPKPQNRNY